jgi:hypothetical protein
VIKIYKQHRLCKMCACLHPQVCFSRSAKKRSSYNTASRDEHFGSTEWAHLTPDTSPATGQYNLHDKYIIKNIAYNTKRYISRHISRSPTPHSIQHQEIFLAVELSDQLSGCNGCSWRGCCEGKP